MGVASIVSQHQVETARELDSTAAETVTEADAVLEGKGERKELNKAEIINIQYVTLNDMTQLAKLYMSIGSKHGLAQKDIM